MVLRFLAVASGVMSIRSGERPLAKVISLLQKMQTQLQAEREDDNAVHEKHDCWCKSEEETMSKQVQVAKATIDRTGAAAKAAFAESQKKGAQRQKATEEHKKKNDELSSQREECRAAGNDFASENDEINQAIGACKQALTVLNKHNFLQGESKMTKSIQDALELVANSNALQTKSSLMDLESFLHPQESNNLSFLQQAPGYQSYANQSGQIFGILNQMLEDLQRDQSEGAKKEEQRKIACTEGIAAMQEEIKLLTNTISELDAALGVLAETQASNEQEFAEAKEAYGNGTTYLGNLKTKCDEHNANHKSRTASREQELLAIADTVEILNNDDAFKSFGKTAAPASFLQVRKVSEHINGELRRSAVAALDKFAAKDARTFLVQYLIKSSQEVGWRAKVQAKIDELSEQLKIQQVEEAKERDECIAGFNAAKLATEEKQRDLATNEDESSRLNEEVEALTGEINTLEEQTAATKKDIQQAGEDRQKEAAEFASSVKDHQDVQGILQKAVDRMNEVYSNVKVGYEFAQQEPASDGAYVVKVAATETNPGSAPAELKNQGKTEQNAGGNKVVAMLQTVMDDSVKTVAELEKSEQDAEAQFTDFVTQANILIGQNNKAVAHKTKRRGDAEKGKAAADAQITAIKKGLYELTEQTLALHESCDFLVANFQARQDARASEMDALQQAKQLIGGMSA